MIYSMKSPYLPYAADAIRTGNYGEDCFDEPADNTLWCSECGGAICSGEGYYDVGGRLYCMDCIKAAEEAILEETREDYKQIL